MFYIIVTSLFFLIVTSHVIHSGFFYIYHESLIFGTIWYGKSSRVSLWKKSKSYWLSVKEMHWILFCESSIISRDFSEFSSYTWIFIQIGTFLCLDSDPDFQTLGWVLISGGRAESFEGGGDCTYPSFWGGREKDCHFDHRPTRAPHTEFPDKVFQKKSKSFQTRISDREKS